MRFNYFLLYSHKETKKLLTLIQKSKSWPWTRKTSYGSRKWNLWVMINKPLPTEPEKINDCRKAHTAANGLICLYLAASVLEKIDETFANSVDVICSFRSLFNQNAGERRRAAQKLLYRAKFTLMGTRQWISLMSTTSNIRKIVTLFSCLF